MGLIRRKPLFTTGLSDWTGRKVASHEMRKRGNQAVTMTLDVISTTLDATNMTLDAPSITIDAPSMTMDGPPMVVDAHP